MPVWGIIIAKGFGGLGWTDVAFGDNEDTCGATNKVDPHEMVLVINH